MKLAMVFPGQGSQSVGMLKAYAGLPEIEAVRAEAAAELGDGFMKILDEGPAEQLSLTVNTQPAHKRSRCTRPAGRTPRSPSRPAWPAEGRRCWGR